MKQAANYNLYRKHLGLQCSSVLLHFHKRAAIFILVTSVIFRFLFPFNDECFWIYQFCWKKNEMYLGKRRLFLSF